MGVALHGNLKDFGIAEVFQLIGQQRKTGLLEIAGETQRVQLAFDEGAVVWAAPASSSEDAVLGDRLVRCGLLTSSALSRLFTESEASARSLPSLLISSDSVKESDLEEISELLSRETIFEVMRWNGGSFHFTAQPIHHDVAADKLLAAEQILMDGLRMLDEWQTFAQLVPSDDCVFQRAGRLDVYRQKVAAGGRQSGEQIDRVYQLIDGRLAARRIIDLSRLGTFEATRILADLHQAGVIAPVDASVSKARKRKRPSGESWLRFAKLWVAAVVPLVLLAGLVFLAPQKLPEEMVLQLSPSVSNQPLDAYRQNFEVRRLRNALDARRHVTGSWPDDIDRPDAFSMLGDLPMASEFPHPYYYSRRGDEIVLLAPRR
jgi:hypothetical protein